MSKPVAFPDRSRPQARPVLRSPILEEFTRCAESGLRSYLIYSPITPPRLTDEIVKLLRCKQPGMQIVNSCGRYASRDAWRARWPQERERYGGAIILTVGEDLADGEPATGAGIPGGHILGEHGAQEVIDLAERRRPLLWLPYWSGQYRIVARFSVEPAPYFATGHCGRLFCAADAEPFAPVIGNLSPFYIVPKGVPLSQLVDLLFRPSKEQG